MIIDRLPIRLYWAGGRGVARFNGDEVRLSVCPQIFEAVVLDAIDYAPTVCAMYMPRFGGWQEMDGAQQQACASHLRTIFRQERRR